MSTAEQTLERQQKRTPAAGTDFSRASRPNPTDQGRVWGVGGRSPVCSALPPNMEVWCICGVTAGWRPGRGRAGGGRAGGLHCAAHSQYKYGMPNISRFLGVECLRLFQIAAHRCWSSCGAGWCAAGGRPGWLCDAVQPRRWPVQTSHTCGGALYSPAWVWCCCCPVAPAPTQ